MLVEKRRKCQDDQEEKNKNASRTISSPYHSNNWSKNYRLKVFIFFFSTVYFFYFGNNGLNKLFRSALVFEYYCFEVGDVISFYTHCRWAMFHTNIYCVYSIKQENVYLKVVKLFACPLSSSTLSFSSANLKLTPICHTNPSWVVNRGKFVLVNN